jgi:Transglycosylase SLT domain
MLNIRISFTIDTKKVTAVFVSCLLFWSQLLSAPANALEVAKFESLIVSPSEKPVTADLTYITVKTTKSDAKKALASPYVKYFDPETIAFLTEYLQGKSMAEWKCLRNLWQGESHFNPKALNMHSHAYGIAQFLPTTWGNYNLTKTSVAQTQIQDGLRYILSRYHTACNAWSFWQRNSWY